MIVDKSSNEHHLKKKEVIVANQSAWAMLEGWANSSMRSLVLKNVMIKSSNKFLPKQG